MPRRIKSLFVLCVALVVVPILTGCGMVFDDEAKDDAKAKPNILFIVLDDVGSDPFREFGYGGVVGTSQTPVMDALASNGAMLKENMAAYKIFPELQQNVRNRDCKLIRLLMPACDPATDACPSVEHLEFYDVECVESVRSTRVVGSRLPAQAAKARVSS